MHTKITRDPFRPSDLQVEPVTAEFIREIEIFWDKEGRYMLLLVLYLVNREKVVPCVTF
jgi:hypothetical protein